MVYVFSDITSSMELVGSALSSRVIAHMVVHCSQLALFSKFGRTVVQTNNCGMLIKPAAIQAIVMQILTFFFDVWFFEVKNRFIAMQTIIFDDIWKAKSLPNEASLQRSLPPCH